MEVKVGLGGGVWLLTGGVGEGTTAVGEGAGGAAVDGTRVETGVTPATGVAGHALIAWSAAASQKVPITNPAATSSSTTPTTSCRKPWEGLPVVDGPLMRSLLPSPGRSPGG